MPFTLDTFKLFEIGSDIDKRLYAVGISTPSELIIKIDNQDFKKLDEDLYYRNNPNGKDFIPSSSGEIILNFKKLSIKILNNQL